MAESDGQEKTEQPTPKRLQESREKGQIPRSKELNTLAALMAASVVFLMMGGAMIEDLLRLLHENLKVSRADLFDVAAMFKHLKGAVFEGVLTVGPLAAVLAVVAILASVALGGWSFSPQAMAFKPEKMDPIKGMQKLFGWKGLVEMLKGLAKFLIVATALVLLLKAEKDTFLGLGTEPLMQGMAHMGKLLRWSFLMISAVLLVVVAIDVPFQLWDHNRQLKMSFQEVKEEMKQTEGSPEVKGRQRQIQMEMSQRRMMEEVPKADVVVTNPTHYAVALRYDQTNAGAPVVTAKGADMVALKIRSIATEKGVPVLSAPPLARSLYHTTELNDSIPTGLYRAVAQVLAYVYHLRQGSTAHKDGAVMADLPIPDDLRRDK